MERVWMNSCPCADPAELQPASLVPTDPSCCLIAQRKAITLKQHTTLTVSRRCLFSVQFSSLTIHGCRCHVYSDPASQIAHLPSKTYSLFFGYSHHLRHLDAWMQTSLFKVFGCTCVIRRCFCLPRSDWWFINAGPYAALPLQTACPSGKSSLLPPGGC